MRLAALAAATLFAVATTAVAQTPVITAVLNPSTSSTTVAPGGRIMINGSNLAASMAPVDCPGPKVPNTCGSVSVTVNGRTVPVRSVISFQVMTYIPSDLSPGTATLILKNHLGLSSAPFTFRVDQYAPAIEKVSFQDGTMLGLFSDTSQRIVSRFNPATPGAELTMYAMGLGPTNPTVPAGETGTAPATTLPVVRVGSRFTPALSSGLGCEAICEPGIYLVRFQLPPDVPSGDQLASVEIAGIRSQTQTLVVGMAPSGPAVGYIESFFDSRVRTVSPGALANVVGGGFLATSGSLSPCLTDPRFWPLTCQGVTVTINGRAAPIMTVMSNSITIQVPIELAPGPATLVVERVAIGQTQRSAAFTFTLEALTPTLPANPGGPAGGIMLQKTGASISPANPLLPGDDIFIYATGLGQTTPPIVSGFSLTQPARTVLSPTVTIGGKLLEGVFAEAMAGTIGQYRVSAHVPIGIAAGDQPLAVEIGGKKSQDGLLVRVASGVVISAVVSAASGVPEISSGSYVSIYGRNLSTTTREWREDDFVYDWLPTKLDGVEVTIDDKPAVVTFVSPTQLNVLVPDNLPAGPLTVAVTSPFGWQKATVTGKTYTPGLFMLPPGPMPYVVALHTDWSYVARYGMFPPNVSVRPAAPGETIVLFGTGFGPTDPPASVYHRMESAAKLPSSVPVRVRIGSQAAAVAYAGMIGNGLYQINVVVPELPNGDYEVVVTMGADASPAGRFLPVSR